MVGACHAIQQELKRNVCVCLETRKLQSKKPFPLSLLLPAERHKMLGSVVIVTEIGGILEKRGKEVTNQEESKSKI